MTVHIAVIEYLVQHPEQAAAVVGVIVSMLVGYRKTGRIPLGRIPFRHLRSMLKDVKSTYFTRGRPSGVPALTTELGPLEVYRKLVSDEHFEGAPYSYNYKDQVLSIRQPNGLKRNPDNGRMTEMETHPRAFETDGGETLWISHHEANRYTETGEHLDPGLYSWVEGRKEFAEALDDAGIEYTEIESETAAGIEVVSQ